MIVSLRRSPGPAEGSRWSILRSEDPHEASLDRNPPTGTHGERKKNPRRMQIRLRRQVSVCLSVRLCLFVYVRPFICQLMFVCICPNVSVFLSPGVCLYLSFFSVCLSLSICFFNCLTVCRSF